MKRIKINKNFRNIMLTNIFVLTQAEPGDEEQPAAATKHQLSWEGETNFRQDSGDTILWQTHQTCRS